MSFRFQSQPDSASRDVSGHHSWEDDLVLSAPLSDHTLGGFDALTPSAVVNGDDGGNNSLFGTSGDDIIHGNGGDDGIYGEQGSDFLYGDDGNDAIFAGDTNGPSVATSDTADGGAGDDTISADVTTDIVATGDAGNDTFNINTLGDGSIDGGDDNDMVYVGASGSGTILVHGGNGDDTVTTGNGGSNATILNVYGDAGADTLTVQSGYANVYGGDDNDIIHASGIFAVTIDGGAGDDYIEIGSPFGPNTTITALTGGTGTNTLQLDTSVNVTFNLATWSASSAGFQNLVLTGQPGISAGITIFAGHNPVSLDFSSMAVSIAAGDGTVSQYNFTINGSDGNDTLVGPDSVSDRLNGGAGNDTLTGGSGNDQIQGGTGDDVLHGGGGNDAIYASDGICSLNGDAGDDILTGGAGTDTLNGGDGNDTITVSAGSNVIDGGDGNDIISAGGTITSLTGGAGDDHISIYGVTLTAGSLNGGTGTDELDLGGAVTLAMANFSAAGTGIEELGIGRSAYAFTGDDNANALDFSGFTLDAANNNALVGVKVNGAGGDDVITGSTANDVITGGDGNDTINIASGGSDTVSGNAGDDIVNVGAGLDGGDSIDGGDGKDTVTVTGEYATQTALALRDVETVKLGAGYDYNLLITDNLGDGESFSGTAITIDGSAVGSHNTLTLDLSHIGNANGFGGVTVKGGNGADTIILGGGANIVSGNAGNDVISGFTNADALNGGTGTDTVILNGDYSGGDTFSATVFTSIEILSLTDGHSYWLTSNDGNVAAAHILTVDASSLTGTNKLIFNGAAETDGRFVLEGGAGNDQLMGGAGNDKFLGNDGNDTFDLSHGGNDVADGGAGDDTMNFGAAFTASDTVDGGTGANSIILSGDYSHGIDFHAATMINVQTIQVSSGFDYRFIFGDANLANGQTLTIDASALGGGNILNANAAHEQSSSYIFDGGAGDDLLTGGAGADTFNLQEGGNDHVSAGAGNDVINMGGALTVDDRIYGSAGSDTAVLDGDYSAGLTFSSATMTDVETLSLTAAHSYKFTTSDGTVAAGQTLTVDGSTLLATDTLNFNGSRELDGKFVLDGGAGADTLVGGAGNDIFNGGAGADSFNLTYGGNDRVTGGDGDDTTSFGATFTASDRVDGGAGNDKVTLAGDYSAGVVFTSASLLNVETLSLGAGFSYKLTTNNATVAVGQTMSIYGAALGTGDSLNFNGAAETDGSFRIYAGAGSDTLQGGTQSDTFVYSSASLSNGAHYDTIKAFDFGSDHIDLSGSISAIDTAVTSGTLDSANFDSELAAAIGSTQLGAHHAVLFTASAGTLSGQTFLIVDLNGTAGYQAGADLVIHMTGATGTLATAVFV
ncbi:MAG TPA: calcium-binding protein [Rhizomicrobium sp.]|jgi:Ca2+-binding RTX toxin-like protein